MKPKSAVQRQQQRSYAKASAASAQSSYGVMADEGFDDGGLFEELTSPSSIAVTSTGIIRRSPSMRLWPTAVRRPRVDIETTIEIFYQNVSTSH